MARANFNDVAIDALTGVALAGVQVTVIDTSTNDNAAIYAAMTGATFRPNPFITGANGVIDFKVNPGAYRLDLHDSVLPARFSDRSLYFEGISGASHGIPISQLDLSSISGDVTVNASGVTTIGAGKVDTPQLANTSVTAGKLALGYGVNTSGAQVNIGTGFADIIQVQPNPATFLFIANIAVHNSTNAGANFDARFRVTGQTPNATDGTFHCAATDDATGTIHGIFTMNGTATVTVEARGYLGSSSNMYAYADRCYLTRLMIG